MPSNGNIFIFPTLVQHALTIEGAGADIWQYLISNQEGRRVRSGRLTQNGAASLTGLEVLKPGIYFITVYTRHQVRTIPFLKM